MFAVKPYPAVVDPVHHHLLSSHAIIGLFVVGAFLGFPTKVVDAAELPATKPEVVGFSSERLGRFDAVMQQMVNDKEFAGIVTMAMRHGKVFQSGAYGLRDIASGAPMQKD